MVDVWVQVSAPTLATLVFGTAVLFRGIDKARLVFEQEIDELNILLLGPRATHTHIPRVDRVIPATCALRVVTPWNVLSNLFPDPPPEPVLCNSAAENVVLSGRPATRRHLPRGGADFARDERRGSRFVVVRGYGNYGRRRRGSAFRGAPESLNKSATTLSNVGWPCVP